MATPAPPPPDAEKPRVVCQYRGMQVMDARDRVLVVIEGEIPFGAAGGLRHEGFRRRSSTIWEAPHNPMNIMAAQAVGDAFFGEAENA